VGDLGAELITGAVSAVLGGLAGLATSTINYRRDRRARSGDDAAANMRRASDLSATLRSRYQQAALTSRWRRPSDRDLASAENAFLGACDASASDELARAARAYIGVGRLYASRDLDSTAAQEETEHDELADLFRRLIREAQAP